MSASDRHATASDGSSEQSAGELMTVAEAIARYRDEQVLRRVPEREGELSFRLHYGKDDPA